MSIKERIKSLQKQHLAADEAVKEHDVPGTCPTFIKGLKLHRLHLKEELRKTGGDTITKDRHKDGPDVDGLRTQLEAANSGGRHLTAGPIRDRIEAEIAEAEGPQLELVHDQGSQPMSVPVVEAGPPMAATA